MSAMGAVSYVGISNHILDAAKSNRCIVLLRQDPGDNEMLRIVDGVLLREEENVDVAVKGVELAGVRYSCDDIAQRLCIGYTKLMKLKIDTADPKTFFGLRDWVFLLKAMRREAKIDQNRLFISLDQFVRSIERNFNGVPSSDFCEVVKCFVEELRGELTTAAMSLIRIPVEVIREALSPRSLQSHTLRPRYKLIIDTTMDDSIMRLLESLNFVESDESNQLKLSNMPEEGDIEKLQLISKVKFAAARKGLIVLSQTESINESFYDLFNLHFRVVAGQQGVNLYSNIAVGGVSRRSLVSEQFECVVHVRESTLEQIPAPFLNRFEKFRLDLDDIFVAAINSSSVPTSVFERSLARVKEVFSSVRSNKIAARDLNETIMSVFVGLLPQGVLNTVKDAPLVSFDSATGLKDAVCNFMSQISSVVLCDEDVADLIEVTRDLLPTEIRGAIEVLMVEPSNVDWDEVVSHDLHLLRREEPCSWNIRTVYFAVICEIALTRNACSKLMHLLTLEEVSELRTVLPLDLIREYFQMDHFSLFTHLGEACASFGVDRGLMIIHTRTHQDVRRLAVSGENEFQDSTNQGSSIGLPDYVMVSHLMDLKSERHLREACSYWAGDSIKQVLVLVVDMATKNAPDAVNFARTLVENVANSSQTKRCIVLLHYPESGRFADYPTLFVGGWRHLFLDSIGTSQSSLGVSHGIQNYCERASDSLSHEFYVDLQRLLPNVLVRLAAHDIVYKEQLGKKGDSLAKRQSFFSGVLEARVDGVKLKEMLCRIFGDLWFGSAMRETIVKATAGMKLRSSNLGINATVRRVGIDAFESFLSLSFCDLNQWQNLSLLQSRRSDILGLFELVMNLTLTFRFGHLLDMSGRKHRVLPYPTVVGKHGPPALFLFYLKISLHMDQLVDRILPAVLSEGNRNDLGVVSAVVRRCHELLASQKDDDAPSSEAAKALLISQVLDFVQNHETEEDSLLERYIMQYLTCRLGCSSQSFLVHWVLAKFDEAMVAKDLVAAHCILRLHEHDLMKITSWVGNAGFGSFLTQKRKCGTLANVDTGFGVMSQCLKSLETRLTDGSMSPRQWSASFASFLSGAAVMKTFAKDESVINKIRALIFFQGIVFVSNGSSVTQRALAALYDVNNGSLSGSLPSLSLQTFWDLLGESSKESSFVAVISTLHSLFSPSWVSICGTYLVEDFRFLITLIADGYLDQGDRLLATSLLTHAISCFDQMPGSQSCQFLGFSLKPLTALARALSSAEKLSQKPITSSSHWYPRWIQNINATITQESKTDRNGFSGLLISDGDLVEYRDECLIDAVFHTCLTDIVQQCSSETSEGAFRRVVDIYDAVQATETQQYARVDDLLKAGEDFRSVIGSPIGNIVLDASVICLVGKIAEECCQLETPAALRGPYALECKQLLDTVMSSRRVLFQEFFASTILRSHGEGTFATFLNTIEVARDFAWLDGWQAGSNESFEASNRELAAAERLLAAAHDEERKKANEIRTCPECGNEFVVAALNCGMFQCGRDAHNQQHIQGHGCGASFNVGNADHYRVDQRRLNGLEAKVNECRLRCDTARIGAKQWEEAKTMQPPPVLCSDLGQSANQCGLPVLNRQQLLSAQETSSSGMLALIGDIRSSSMELSLLPYLVELYCWIHDTFSHVMAREMAYNQTVAEVVKTTLVASEQQEMTYQNLLDSWNTVENGWSQLMESWDDKVAWNCTEVKVPFRSIGNVPFSTLLSEGSDPLEEGNDYLFMVVHNIIQRYNDFVRRFEELQGQETHVNPIHPRFLAPGGSGSLALGALKHLADINLDVFVATAWDSDTGQLDQNKFSTVFHSNVAIEHAGGLHPIRDPLSLLRKRFVFRITTDGVDSGSDRVTGVFVAEDGKLFATRQDRELYTSLLTLLSELGLSAAAADKASRLHSMLRDVFYSLSYQHLLEVLVGFRNMLSCADKDGIPVYLCFTLKDLVSKILEIDADEISQNGAEAMAKLGFPPDLRKNQIELLLSIKSSDMQDTISFFGDQVASGAFLFASLPFCVREEVREEAPVADEIKMIAQVEGIEKCVELMDEFINDVLSFYEAPIVEAANQSSSPKLRAFLRDQNFCDESDPIFAILPDNLSVRNYTSVRLLLYRLKLKLMQQLSMGSGAILETEADERNDSKEDHSWLWEQPEWLDVHLVTNRRDAKEGEDEAETGVENYRVTEEQINLFLQGIHAARIQRFFRHFVAVRNFQKIVAARKIWRCWKQYDVETEAEAVKENYFRLEAAETIQMWWRFLKRKGLEAANNVSQEEVRIRHQTTATAVYNEVEMKPTHDALRSSTAMSSLPERHSVHATAGAGNQQTATYHDRPERRVPYFDSTPVAESEQRQVPPTEAAYDGADAEAQAEMRTWLSFNRLTETVMNQLLDLGARNVEDVIEVVQEDPDLLESFLPLDVRKLGRADDRMPENMSVTELEQRGDSQTDGIYGNSDAKAALGRWLSASRLPETVTIKLLELGARDIEDVSVIVQDFPDLLSGLRPLDVRKLERAEQDVASCAPGTLAQQIGNLPVAYGSADAETEMRRWLSSNRLADVVTNQLVDVGARDVEDVAMLVHDWQDLLSGFRPLDLRKLNRAVKKHLAEQEAEQEEEKKGTK